MRHTSRTAALNQGYILVLALVFLGIFFTASAAYLNFVTTSARSARVDIAQSQALAIAEAGMNKAVYQLNQNPSYTGETNTTFGEGVFTVTVSNINSVTKRVTATGYVPNSTNPTATKTIKADVGINGAVVSFRYGVQAGMGGFSLENTSSITGNVYSGGSVIGSSQNYIYGDVISAGPSGVVYGIHATSSVYAHTIGNTSKTTIVDKNAYYATSKVNTTVGGTSYPNSPDQATTSLPISDAQIAEWETIAANGGTAACSSGSYAILSGAVSLGPVKIPCNLTISGTSVVTLNGHVWVTGNIIIQNSAVVKIAPSLGAENITIIADNPSNRLTSSTIAVKNTASFQGSGTAGSFILLVSQNNSAENGGSVNAIELENSVSAMIAYAAHGLIPLENTVSLKEVTAYKITLKNSANVRYDTGLISTVFDSGPGGSWSFIPGTYAITR
ncbi:MAG: hypothetical protein Q7T37_01265 [bacterium]|nr:hypothetical protein [bacterium]MDO8742262.1 hypothetical protein [bacterium]